MKKMLVSKAVARSLKVREIYHRLELLHHGSEWTAEEDALAFLTDAGLVGRLTMARKGRWPIETEKAHKLEHKIPECIWWLIVLAQRMDIDVERALETFLEETELQLKHSLSRPRRRSKSNLVAKRHSRATTASRTASSRL